MFRKIFNIYDTIIVFLIMGLSAGICGGAYSPSRMFALLFSPLFLAKVSVLLKPNAPISRPLIFGCSIFLVYALFSLLWTPNQTQGGKEVVYYCAHFLLLLEIVVFGKFAKKPLSSICFGWATAVLLTVPIALNEFIFDSHLTYSIVQSDVYTNFGAGLIMVRRFASVAFGNQNGYSLFLVFGTLFSLCGILLSRKISSFIFYGLITGFSSFAILINASRGAIFSIGVVWCFFIYFYFRSTLRYKNIFFLVFSLGLVIFAMMYADILFAQIEARLRSVSMLSDDGRFSLMRNGINIFLNSGMLGCGIGGVSDAYLSLSGTSSIIVPHNLLLECLVQYGLLGEVLLLCLLFNIFRYGRKNPFFICRYIVYATIFAFPFWSVINSLYLLEPLLWCVLGCICFVVEHIPHDFANVSNPHRGNFL